MEPEPQQQESELVGVNTFDIRTDLSQIT